MNASFLAASVGLVLICVPGALEPAHADDCSPLTLITSVSLTQAEDKAVEFVPVKLAGADKLMLLDTGGAISEVTNGAVDELGLPHRHGNVALYNVSGQYSTEFAHGPLELGTLKADDVAFMVAPGSDMFGGNKQIAGVLAPDILKHYDVHIDFSADKLSLLSQNHCEGKVIYWPAAAVAVVPMRVLNSGHIIVPVEVDGHSIYALIDTGASGSTLTIPEAEGTFGLKLGSADTPMDGALKDQPGSFTYKHRFHTLTFDGIAVTNPTVMIIPDMNGDRFANDPQTGTRLSNPSTDEDKATMLIGMDVLKHLNLYIAYKEEKLYITPATPPDAQANEH